MRTNLLLLAFSLLSISAIIAQDYTCNDFREGAFFIAAGEIIPENVVIHRTGNTQIETAYTFENNVQKKSDDEIVGKIQWIDDCTYKLVYDESKMTLSSTQKLINEGGGIIVELVKIEGHCFYFKSTSTINGEEYLFEDKMCKNI
jgi:hypothetical protein